MIFHDITIHNKSFGNVMMYIYVGVKITNINYILDEFNIMKWMLRSKDQNIEQTHL